MSETLRKVIFSEEDYRDNFAITSCSESLVSDKEWEEFADKALVLADGDEIYQYAEEYPIVVYCDDECELNAFIESITVSTASYGKRFSLHKREMVEEYTGPDTVVYFTDNTNRKIVIQQHDIFYFLLKKPELVITVEGFLVFYTEKEILITNDCDHYAWSGVEIDTDGSKKITELKAYDDGECCVTVVDTEDYDEKGKPKKYFYNLRINFDMATAHGTICTEIARIENNLIKKEE